MSICGASPEQTIEVGLSKSLSGPNLGLTVSAGHFMADGAWVTTMTNGHDALTHVQVQLRSAEH